ncbi:MAG: glycerol kinase GlpK [Anaerolineae bacterium]|nr:glycerol kinase GlpK [Anaerolineae bacterium]
MKETNLFLAIDQSTSATKALLFNFQGELIDQASLPHRQIYPQPGWVEHDAEEIYRNVIAAAAQLMAKSTVLPEHLRFVSITNQRETFVVFERNSGKPIHHAIVWQCTRGEPICRKWAEAGYENLVQQQTGLRIDSYFPASKMQWLLENNPEIQRKVQQEQALLGTIDAYLIHRLTRGRVYASDHTNASRTLLYDIHKLDWSDDLLKMAAIPRHALPEVRSCDAYYGETDFDGVLPSPLPIYGVMGDSQAALFAQRCYQPGSAKITFGTGSSILVNTGSEPLVSKQGLVTALAWVLDGTPTYAFEGILNFTGATIQWLRDQLGVLGSAAESETLAASVPDNAGVYLVPAFVGLGAPYWSPEARGAIVGLTPSATRAHVVRAGLEAIAYLINDVLSAVRSTTPFRFAGVHADGGAARNAFLMQFVSDITRLDVQAALTPELSALGAGFAGMLGMGIVKDLNDLQALPFTATVYHPCMPAETAAQLNQEWQRAVKKVLS